jgi:hypothetical protein
VIWKSLFIHQLKSLVRSPNLRRELGVRIFIGFMVLVMALNLLAMGFSMKEILTQLEPGKDPVSLFNGYILYYLSVDLLLRLMLQAVPGLSIRSYLHLPIQKSVLVHYLLSKTMGSIFNYLPLFILLPFAMVAVVDSYAPLSVIAWFLGIGFMLFANAYIALYINRASLRKFLLGLVLLSLVAGLFVLNYAGIIEVNTFSSLVFDSLLRQPILVVIPLCWWLVMYSINFFSVRNQMFLEQLEKGIKTREVVVREIGLLNKLGPLGDYIDLELKLIFRNKRLKNTTLLSLPFLLFGFYIYPQEEFNHMLFFLIYFGIVLIGYFMINYGQFLMAWESEYFDLILTRSIDLRLYLKAKYLIMAFSCLILFLLLAPFAFYDARFLYINAILTLFNIGIGASYLLLTGTANRTRVDLQVSSFSWQGRGARQFFLAFVMILLPMVLYYPVYWLTHRTGIGLLSLGVAGLTGILLSSRMITVTMQRFERHKYVMASGFRKNI